MSDQLDRRGREAADSVRAEVGRDEIEAALSSVRLAVGGPSGHRYRRRFTVGVAAAAIVVLVIGLVLIVRPHDADRPLASVPSSTVVSSLPSANVVATAPANLVPVITAPGSIVPTSSVPVTTTVESASTGVPASGGPVPLSEGVEPVYVGSDAIWVLGRSGALWRSTDVGNSWTERGTPADGIAEGGEAVFTDADHGFAINSARTMLYGTADAGATWFPLPTDAPTGLFDLAVGGGHVHALGLDSDPVRLTLYSAVIGRQDSLSSTGLSWAPGAGGEPHASFAFAGDSGRMTVTVRTLVGAATFDGGGWAELSGLDCLNGGIDVFSAGADDVLQACHWGEWGGDGNTPDGTRLSVSGDAGQTFTDVTGPPTRSGEPSWFHVVARPAVGVIVINGDQPMVTRDEGATWRPLGIPDAVAVSRLESSGDLWIAAGSTPEGLPGLWISDDAGTTWRPIS